MDASARLAFNMKVLRRHDASIDDILESASFVVLYEHTDDGWAKTGIEGPMFLYRRNAAPSYGFFIMNRNGVENFSAALSLDDDLELTSEFIIYRPASEDDDEEEEEGREEEIYGIWVFEQTQRATVGEQMIKLQQMPQMLSGAPSIASAAGVAAPPAPQTNGTAASAKQAISLDDLFGAPAASAASSSQPSEPAPPAQPSGLSLLDSMFQKASLNGNGASPHAPPSSNMTGSSSLLDDIFSGGAAPQSQAPPASALPEPTLPSQAGSSSAPTESAAPTEPTQREAPSAAGLLALLGIGKAAAPPSNGGSSSATVPTAPAASSLSSAVQQAGQKLSLDALFGNSANGAKPAPSAPAPAAAPPRARRHSLRGHATLTPMKSRNPTYDAARAPSWDDLPRVAGQPHGCAWGLFDVDGQKDELGTLNFLTAANAAKAAGAEIRTGERVQLDWSLDRPAGADHQGAELSHEIIHSGASHSNAQKLSLPSQGGSRLESARHAGFRKDGLYYNGLHHRDFRTSPVDAARSGKEAVTQNGTHAWCDAGGIAGRGVLLDWYSWYARTHPGQSVPSATSAHAIPLSDLLACAKAQGTELRPADILFVRTGFTAWYETASIEERAKGVRGQEGSIGVQNSEEVRRWLWDSHFALVAGDAMDWEVRPATGSDTLWLHEWLLAMWGMPIGKMLDLESLSETCERLGRWSFFLTAAPLRLPGGVSSPANMVAIF